MLNIKLMVPVIMMAVLFTKGINSFLTIIMYYSDCDYAGIRCNRERLGAQNVNVSTDTATNTVMVSWELYSGVTAPYKPKSFRVRCYNHQGVREFSLWVSNETLTCVSVGGVLSSISFYCCVSITYVRGYWYYEAEGRCASTDSNNVMPLPENQPVTIPSSTQMISGSEKVVGSDLNMRANIVGGVLGSIIIILLLLLAMCGGALLFFLRSRSTNPKMQVYCNQ